MRLLPWLGAFLLAGLIAVTVGAVIFNRGGMAPSTSLAAARPTALAPYDNGEIHRLLPKDLRPLPSPTPSAAPVAVAAAPPGPAPQQAIVVRTTQQALINSDRASRGLGPLNWSACLYNVALANARRIAAQEALSHTNGPSLDLSCGLGRQAGENIGWYSGGINDAWMNSAFMASPDHYANIMGPYHYVATAWVTTPDGKGWIAVEFG